VWKERDGLSPPRRCVGAGSENAGRAPGSRPSGRGDSQRALGTLKRP
jgi:hypothetical protein